MTNEYDLRAINAASASNLVTILDAIYTSNNLLVLNSTLLALLNYLTPFLRLKERGKFQKLVWLGEFRQWQLAVAQFDGLIVLAESDDVGELVSFVRALPTTTKVYLVVKNLAMVDVALLEVLSESASTSDAAKITLQQVPLGSNHIKLSRNVRLYNWHVYPIVLDLVVSLQEPLDSYWHQPLKHVSQLGAAIIDLIRLSPQFTGTGKLLKLRNIYAKGDHLCLLAQQVQHDRLDDFLSLELDALEQQFYRAKARADTDLVVLERNLDYTAVAFNQLNYQGLIDDLFGIQLDVAQLLPLAVLNDELYQDLQHLNFASIGHKLNHLARAIQVEYLKKDSVQTVQEIKLLVNNLGPLTNRHELIKRHTEISEAILNYIKFGNPTTDPTQTTLSTVDEYERYLEFQNDVFDLDYKLQMSALHQFCNANYSARTCVLAMVLVSTISDGLKERDFDGVVDELVQNHGLGLKFTADNLVKYKVIKVVSGGSDLFSFGLRDKLVQPVMLELSDGYDNIDKLGVTAGQAGLKASFNTIDKFFNLHPDNDANAVPAAAKDGQLVNEYLHPTFALPSLTVPVLARLVEALYARDFLTYKPVNNVLRRANWTNLGLDTMFAGKTLDVNLADIQDNRAASALTNYVLIVVVGGITRAEISCLKYIEQRLNGRGHNKRFIVLTSGIVNSKRLLEAAQSPDQKPHDLHAPGPGA